MGLNQNQALPRTHQGRFTTNGDVPLNGSHFTYGLTIFSRISGMGSHIFGILGLKKINFASRNLKNVFSL